MDNFGEGATGKGLTEWLKSTASRSDEERTDLSFAGLTVQGSRCDWNVQRTCLTYPLALLLWLRRIFRDDYSGVTILHDLEGYAGAGEMCLVLGRPGSGCSTFLKTIAQRPEGLQLNKKSRIYYNRMCFNSA
jgi:hypothetical protein